MTRRGGRPGAGEVTLWAVDYGVLSLTELSRARRAARGLSRQGAAGDERGQPPAHHQPARADAEGRRAKAAAAATKAGAGDFRRDFRPLAFWLGSVETDATGRATRDVTLPESLTTYRIMAVAGDAASRFGSADAEIKVNKPVTLLAAFPRFLGAGRSRVVRRASSPTRSRPAATPSVTIRSLDPAVLQFAGRHVADDPARRRRDRARALRRDGARRRHRARADDGHARHRDGRVRDDAPRVGARRRSRQRRVRRHRRHARASGSRCPPASCPASAACSVDLASTALVGLGEGARYLADYPYGCAEQKASAALALRAGRRSRQRVLDGPHRAGRLSRASATSLLDDLPTLSVRRRRLRLLAGRLPRRQRLPHELRAARDEGRRRRSGSPPDDDVVERGARLPRRADEDAPRRSGAVAAGLEREPRRSA